MRFIATAAACCAASLIVVIPATSSGFAATSAAARCGSQTADTLQGDYNGDGHVDNAVGIPGAGSGKGAIEILSHGHKAVIVRPGANSVPAVTAGAAFGSSLSPFDVNGDNCSDLLVGIPDLNVNGNAQAGGVQVLIGTKSGLKAGPLITAATAGVPGDPAPNAHFGTAVSGFIQRAGETEIKVGVPGATVMSGSTPLKQAGEVVSFELDGSGGVDVAGSGAAITTMAKGAQAGAHYGTVAEIADGVATAPDAANGNKSDVGYFEVDGIGFFGASAGDRLGASFSFGPALRAPDDFDGLFVGAPGHTVSGHAKAGEVERYDFDPDNETASFVSAFTQASSGVPGSARAGARFGAALSDATTTSEEDDVLVGAPGQSVSSLSGAGAVYVDDLADGRSGTVTRVWSTVTQATPGVPGAPRTNAGFGSSLTAFITDITRTAFHERAVIGIPRFHSAGKPASGAIVAMPVGKHLPTVSQAELHRRVDGPKAGDKFGAALG